MATSSPYTSKGGNNKTIVPTNNDDDLSSLTKKVEADLRQNIRLFATFPYASTQWVETVKRIANVASIVEAERNIAELNDDTTTTNNSILNTKKSNSTLWETEEHALRILLEENKFSVLLRIGEEHIKNRKLFSSLSVSKSILTSSTNNTNSSLSTVVSLQAFVEEGTSTTGPGTNLTTSTSSSNPNEEVASYKLNDLLKIFSQLEHGLTVLYTIAWLHPEITQLMDLPLVITILSETMQTANTLIISDINTTTTPSSNTNKYTSSLTLFSFGLSIWYSLGTSIVQGRKLPSLDIIIKELYNQNCYKEIIQFFINSIEIYLYYYNPTTQKLKSPIPTTALSYEKPYNFTILCNSLIGISTFLTGEEYFTYKNKIIQAIYEIDNNNGPQLCTKLRDYINTSILNIQTNGISSTSTIGTTNYTLPNPISPSRIYSSSNSSLISSSPSSSSYNNNNTVNTGIRKQIRPFLDLLELIIRKK